MSSVWQYGIELNESEKKIDNPDINILKFHGLLNVW